MSDRVHVQQIPAAIVRAIAETPPSPGDFRARFPKDQPHIAAFVEEELKKGTSDVAREFSARIAAGLWAIYEMANDDHGGVALVRREALEAIRPSADGLVSKLINEKGGAQDFDAEWLIDLPRGPQPHVMGFLVGALRASRFRLTGVEILQAVCVLLTVAGALEGAAYQKRRSSNEGEE